MEILPRFFKPPRQSYFLFGPRGTGKSLWARQQYPDALWVDLLEADTLRQYSARPERLRELLAGNPRAAKVVIDEVQRVPDLLSVVHELLEKRRGLQFILTGSSARKLKRAGVDLLAGRAVLRSLHPFMAAELGKRFDLGNALRRGLLPLVLDSQEPDDVLKAYHALYLREEVQAEGLVRNLGAFSRFLEAISLSHASVLNLSNVARECEVERKTVVGYVAVLEDLLLSFRVPVFTRRGKRETAVHHKFYYFDAGVFRSLRPTGPLDHPSEIEGAGLEGLVVQHLRAWNAYRGDRNQLSYWRTRSNVEVDSVIYGADGLWAVEVKSTSKVRPGDLKPLRLFREDYPEARVLFIYRGPDVLEVDGILCIPCQRFLTQLDPSESVLWSG